MCFFTCSLNEIKNSRQNAGLNLWSWEWCTVRSKTVPEFHRGTGAVWAGSGPLSGLDRPKFHPCVLRLGGADKDMILVLSALETDLKGSYLLQAVPRQAGGGSFL